MSDIQDPARAARAEVSNYLNLHQYRHFSPSTLKIESQALRGNPLNDDSDRINPVLVPKAAVPSNGFPVVFVLSGFTGNGTYYFNQKSFEPNLPTVLDRCVGRGEAPNAVFVLVDAWTAWGGSQFINSRATGRY